MKKSIKILLAATATLSLGAAGIALVCPTDGDGCGSHGPAAQAKTAATSKASALPAMFRSKANGDDCGMGRGDNCNDGCEQGVKTGTKTVNASLVSGKAMCESHGQFGNHDIAGAKRTIKMTSRGVSIEIASDDPTLVAAFHARFGKMQNASPMSLGSKANGNDCGMDCDDNCDDGCEHGAEIGTKTVNASLASGKTMREGHGRHGNYGIEGAKRTIKMTPRGIIIEITSDDPTVIAAIQARFSKKQVTTEIASTKP